ncbi:MAG: hypothetical protein AAB480_02370 [Patescibacteria group bacterium]
MHKGNKKIVISATVQVQRLWQKGYFKLAKTLAAVDEHLAKDGYNFGASELAHALARAPYLTRKGKRGAYTYIQKGPYQQNET